MKKILISICILIANIPQIEANQPAAILFNMSSTYSQEESIAIVVINRTPHSITIPETGNCHQFFKVFDSTGKELLVTNPYAACTLDFRTQTIEPLQTKIIDSWNQKVFRSTCSLGQYWDHLLPCSPTEKFVDPGNYSIEVAIENFGSITHEFGIIASRTFDDVPQSHWAYQYIQSLFEKQIVQGYGNGNFGPDSGITRAEVLKMALGSATYKKYRTFTPGHYECSVGSSSPSHSADYETARCSNPPLSMTLPYQDVSPQHPLYPFIYQAYIQGIIKPSTYFYPDQKASRIECLQYIVDAFGQTPGPIPMNAPQTFSDVNSPSERAYTDSAAAAGIVSGSQGKFYPDQAVTRAEISKILANMITN